MGGNSLFDRTSKRRGRRTKEPRQEEPYAWLWSCCSCWEQAGIPVANERCSICSHGRCSGCPLERVRVPSASQFIKQLHPRPKQEAVLPQPGVGDGNGDGETPPVSPQWGYYSDTTSGSETFSAMDLDNESIVSSAPGSPAPEIILIPITTSSEDDDIFVLREVEDSDLLYQWHNAVLTAIALQPQEFEGLASIHLIRQGLSEQDSTPTIVFSTTAEDHAIQHSLRVRISKLLDEPMRSQLKILFEESTLRRSLGDSLPPICEPRNTAFQQYPSSGASIGIQHRVDLTATLGGFLAVDGTACILTVDHIVTEDLANSDRICVTHPSEQEGQGKPQWQKIEKHLPSLSQCCVACATLHRQHCHPSNFYKAVDIQHAGVCTSTVELQRLKADLLQTYPSRRLGSLICKSDMRSRSSNNGQRHYQVEMDWALFSTDEWPCPIESHMRKASHGLHFSEVIPGARIKATGRTSGTQAGQVNGAKSLIRHGSRLTEEWTIIRDPAVPLREWKVGGIGVDGDSGAWVVDASSKALYGMVWGRDRVRSNPICLFSPVLDVVADIKERMSAMSVVLPGSDGSMLLEGGIEQGFLPMTSLITTHQLADVKSSDSTSNSVEVISTNGVR